jgi:hypothetical protein
MIEEIATHPLLSLILCSRNDDYMGNSRWRLETTLNFVADQVEALGRTKDVEVLVADWGSEVPLRDVLRLTPAAAAIVSFVLIPPEIARPLQKDSPFPEVLALNAAARRSRGTYIGRIDQDTLVGRRFLEVFFQLCDGRRQLPIPLDRSLLYSNRRAIPFWFAVRCPSPEHVANFIRLLGERCRVTRLRKRKFWTYFVGIWLIHRNIWTECGGYDERFIYYDWMEVEMILRLRQRYTLIDFGKIVGCDFYHLEHRNPRAGTIRWRHLGFRPNTFEVQNLDPGAPPLPYHPNSDNWGLAEFELEASAGSGASPPQDSGENPSFAALVAHTAMQLVLDKTYFLVVGRVLLWTSRAKKASADLRRRAGLVRAALSGKPIKSWYRLLCELWIARQATRGEASRRT